MKNSGLQIIDFEPEHFLTMRLRKEDALDLEGIDREALISSWQGGRTVLKDGQPAFIFGYTAVEGVVSIWAVTSPLVHDLGLMFTRLAKTAIRGFLRAGAHRVEAYCHADNVRSLAWLTRSLGMRVEGLMRRCGPNKQDRFLLSITTEIKE